MVERLTKRIAELEERKAQLVSELLTVNTKIDVYNEVIEEMTAEATECVEKETEEQADTFDVVQ